jgi:hypothetical protein
VVGNRCQVVESRVLTPDILHHSLYSLNLALAGELGLGDDGHVDNVAAPLAVHERLSAGGEGGAWEVSDEPWGK